MNSFVFFFLMRISCGFRGLDVGLDGESRMELEDRVIGLG